MKYGFNADKSKALMFELVEANYSYSSAEYSNLAAVLTTTPAYKYPKLRVVDGNQETVGRNLGENYIFELKRSKETQMEGMPEDTISRYALYKHEDLNYSIVIEARSTQYISESSPHYSNMTIRRVSADGTITTLGDWLKDLHKKVYLATFENGQHL